MRRVWTILQCQLTLCLVRNKMILNMISTEYLLSKICSKRKTHHRVIILNRGSMFAFQWREFSPPSSSAHRFLQCYHRQKRDRRRCNSRGIPPQPPATRVISQWASSHEWRHAVTYVAHSGRENLHQFLPILLLRHALSTSIMTLWDAHEIDW